MSVVRWTLTEKGTATTWTMPLNPNEMTALPVVKNLLTVSTPQQPFPATFMGQPNAQEISWGGVILTQSHYDNLVLWSRKPGVIVVEDHLGRSFEVLIISFEPDPPPGRAADDLKQKYTITALFLRRLT